LELERAGLRIRMGQASEAQPILDAALAAASAPQWRLALALTSAKRHVRQENDGAEDCLAQAQQALAQVKDPKQQRDFEAQWCAASALMLVMQKGLPDRAQAPLARALELA